MASRRQVRSTAIGGNILGLFDPNTRQTNRKDVSLLTAFPLLAIPVLVYNLFAVISLFGGGSDAAYSTMTAVLFSIPMPSPGSHWAVSLGDIILFGSLICLFFELLKATQSDNVAIVNHSLSMVLFVICLVEFLLIRSFATSVFFLMSMMTFMDVLAGFIVTAISARKDIDFGG
jgi:hypothetical protein